MPKTKNKWMCIARGQFFGGRAFFFGFIQEFSTVDGFLTYYLTETIRYRDPIQKKWFHDHKHGDGQTFKSIKTAKRFFRQGKRLNTRCVWKRSNRSDF